MNHYMYDQRGSADKYYYQIWDIAVAHMLRDEGYKSLDDYKRDLEADEVEFTHIPYLQFSVDDGGPVIETLIEGRLV